MATCDVCGREEGMPYQCRLCGGTFCSDHRLPESHDCPGLDNWNDPGGVFDSGFDDSVRTERSTSRSVMDAIPVDTGPGGTLAYFRENMTFVFLAVIWLVYVVQYGIAPLLGIPAGSPAWFNIFTLNSAHPEYVWTWITSIFAHGGFTHILFNSIVLYFFGPVVERRIGTKAFSALFIGAGALAGLAQVGVTLLLHPEVFGVPPYLTQYGTAVLGASGGISALLGVLTILNPNLRIYLYFVIPMPLWVATALFVGYSVLVSTVGGIGFGGVAQLAHLAGLAIGLGYGLILKRRGARAPSQLQFGGGGGRGGGRRGRF